MIFEYSSAPPVSQFRRLAEPSFLTRETFHRYGKFSDKFFDIEASINIGVNRTDYLIVILRHNT